MGQRLRVPRWKEGNTLHVSCDQIYTSSSIESHNRIQFSLRYTNIFSNQSRYCPYSLESGSRRLNSEWSILKTTSRRSVRTIVYRKLPSKHISNYNCHIIEIFTIPISKDYKIKPRDRFSPTQLIIIVNFISHSNSICFWNNARCSSRNILLFKKKKIYEWSRSVIY